MRESGGLPNINKGAPMKSSLIRPKTNEMNTLGGLSSRFQSEEEGQLNSNAGQMK